MKYYGLRGAENKIETANYLDGLRKKKGRKKERARAGERETEISSYHSVAHKKCGICMAMTIAFRGSRCFLFLSASFLAVDVCLRRAISWHIVRI